jgi:pullulanase/glycogen debranching enzyme
LHDASFLVLFNTHDGMIEFKLPEHGGTWAAEVDTSYETGEPAAERTSPQGVYPLQGRSIVILREVPAGGS